MGLYYPQAVVNVSIVADGFGTPDKPFQVAGVIPKSFKVNCNSYKEADTFEVSFDAKVFPFSPQIIRSAAVEIYLFQTKAFERPDFDWSEAKYRLITGLVDEAELHNSTESTVSWTGRDYTSLMIDRKWDPNKSGEKGRIPVSRPLTEVVQLLVDQCTNPDVSGLTLKVVLEDELDPLTGEVAVTKTKNKTKATEIFKSKTKTHKRGRSAPIDTSHWDQIYKICLLEGYIVFVRGQEVVITKPNILHDKTSSKIIRMAYGKNLAELSVTRSLLGEAIPTVLVKAYSRTDRKIIEAVYPEKNVKVASYLKIDREEFRIYTYDEVQNEAELRNIAQTLFHSTAKGEAKVKFLTKSLTDLDDVEGNVNDLLQWRHSDPVALVWDTFDKNIMLNQNVSPDEKIQHVVDLGYSFEIAEVVVSSYDQLDYFSQPFYTKEVSFDWSGDGLSISGEAINYIEPSRDKHADA